jgi:Putative DNA-binding domain
MLNLNSKKDLQRLIDQEIQERLTLDKDSRSLAKDDKQRNELCKDVSAFANSAGGQIIYGIVEKDRKPISIDNGSDLTREWIEQVIDAKIQPRLEGLIITPISVGGGRNAYVLTIQQAMTRAPHQAPDNKYYKRQNFQSVPMEDYEIRDILRRATTPELHVGLSFGGKLQTAIEFPSGEYSTGIGVRVTVTNSSTQPAFHVAVMIGFDTSLQLRETLKFVRMPSPTSDDRHPQHWLGGRLSYPPDLPIFKEVDPPHSLSFVIAVPRECSGEHLFHLTTSVQTPGYSATEKWIIHARAGILRMCPPGHPLNPTGQ